VILTAACATVPLTERTSLRLIPENELLALSLQQYSEVLNKSTLSTDQDKVTMVTRVGRRIAGAADALLPNRVKDFRWEFNLIQDDKVVNAWCMPGGKVAIYSGILPVCRNETGVAVVMGHEVAHAIAGHGNERLSQALVAQGLGVGLSAALASRSAETRALSMAAFGLGAQVGFLLPYSRLHESEADRIGLILMAKAGYNPREAVPFWRRMNEQGGARPPEFLSTHPAPESRIAAIQSHIPEALRYYGN